MGQRHPENLKPFPKGVSGNPKGRPRTRILREYARKFIEEETPEGKSKLAEEFVKILIKFARKGSLGHWQQFAQLIESDTAGTVVSALDTDAINRLVQKLLR